MITSSDATPQLLLADALDCLAQRAWRNFDNSGVWLHEFEDQERREADGYGSERERHYDRRVEAGGHVDREEQCERPKH
jgi:hypothetical protein